MMEKVTVERMAKVMEIVAKHEAVTPDMLCYYLDNPPGEGEQFGWFDVTDLLHELLNLGMIEVGTKIGGIAQDAVLTPELSGVNLRGEIEWRKKWRDEYKEMEKEVKRLKAVVWRVQEAIKEKEGEHVKS